MDIKKLTQEVLLKNMTPEQQMAVLDSVAASVKEAKAVQKLKIAENVDLVLQALKRIEGDMLKRVDSSAGIVETRVKSIKDGKDGKNGLDGRAGKDGINGKAGQDGRNGKDGINGVSGERGQDGISVSDAHIDFDGSLIISLSNGQELNVGEVVPFDVAEKIKVIGNGGGTSQYVLDTLASLQAAIAAISPTLVLTDTFVVSSQAAMLALTGAEQGDVAVRTDLSKTFILKASPYSTLANWQELLTPTDTVTSVAGRTGAVTLSTSDISGLGTIATQNANAVAITGGTVSSSTFTSNTVSNNLAFTPAAAPSYAEGDVWYDSTQHSLAYYNDATNNLVHVGQEVQTKVINNTGSTITVGAPVYVTSTSSGQIYPNVALAKADSIATSSVLGLATNNIANGASGYVTSYGILQPCNTGLFNVGDVLYLSPYTAGVLMNTVPPTGSVIIVGVVAYKNSPNGSIYVKQQNSYIVAASTITGVLAVTQGGTGVTASTGSGNTVLSTSPTLVTPILGTPTSGNLANCTFPTLNQNTTGSSASCTGNAATATNVAYSGLTGTVPTWNQNTTGSAGSVVTTGFSIVESGGKLLFKYGATTIASMSSTGIITSATSIVSNGTP